MGSGGTGNDDNILVEKPSSMLKYVKRPYVVPPGTGISAIQKTTKAIADSTEGALLDSSDAKREVQLELTSVILETDIHITIGELSTDALMKHINGLLNALEKPLVDTDATISHTSKFTKKQLKELSDSLPTIIKLKKWWLKDNVVTFELRGNEGLHEICSLVHVGENAEWVLKRLTPFVVREGTAVFYPHLSIFDVVVTSLLGRFIVFRLYNASLQLTSPVIEVAMDSKEQGSGERSSTDWGLVLPRVGDDASSGSINLQVEKVIRTSNDSDHPSVARVRRLRSAVDPVDRHAATGGMPISILVPNVTSPSALGNETRFRYFTGTCRFYQKGDTKDSQPQREKKQPFFMNEILLLEIAQKVSNEYAKPDGLRSFQSENTPSDSKSPSADGGGGGGGLSFYSWDYEGLSKALESKECNLSMVLDARRVLRGQLDTGVCGRDNDVTAVTTVARASVSHVDGRDLEMAAAIHDTGRFCTCDNLAFAPDIDINTLTALVSSASTENDYNGEWLSHVLVFNSLRGSESKTEKMVVDAVIKFGRAVESPDEAEAWGTGLVRSLAMSVVDKLELDNEFDRLLFPSPELTSDRLRSGGYEWSDPLRAVVKLYRWVCGARIRRVAKAATGGVVHVADRWSSMHTAVLHLLLEPVFSSVVSSGVWAVVGGRRFVTWATRAIMQLIDAPDKRAALVVDKPTLNAMGRLIITQVIILSAASNGGVCAVFGGGARSQCFYLEPGKDLVRHVLSSTPGQIMNDPWNAGKSSFVDRVKNEPDAKSVAFSIPTAILSSTGQQRDVTVIIHPHIQWPSRPKYSSSSNGKVVDYSPPGALVLMLEGDTHGFTRLRDSGMLEAKLAFGTTAADYPTNRSKEKRDPCKFPPNVAVRKTDAKTLEHVTLFLSGIQKNASMKSGGGANSAHYVSVQDGPTEVVFWDPMLSHRDLIKAAKDKPDAMPDLNDPDVSEVFLRDRLSPLVTNRIVFRPPTASAASIAYEALEWIRRQMLKYGGEGVLIQGQKDGVDDIFDDDDYDCDLPRDATDRLSPMWDSSDHNNSSAFGILQYMRRMLPAHELSDEVPSRPHLTPLERFLESPKTKVYRVDDSALPLAALPRNVVEAECFLRQRFPLALASIIVRLAMIVNREELIIIQDICGSIASLLADSLLIAVDPNVTDKLLAGLPSSYGVSVSSQDGNISVLGASRSAPAAQQAQTSLNAGEGIHSVMTRYLKSSMDDPPTSRLLTNQEMARLESSGCLNAVHYARYNGTPLNSRTHTIDRSAVLPTEFPLLTTLYVPVNPRHILADDQWAESLVLAEAGTRRAAIAAHEQRNTAIQAGKQLHKLATDWKKRNNSVREWEAEWLKQRVDKIVPIRDTALRNAAIMSLTPKLVQIEKYNLTAVVKTMTDMQFYATLPNLWLKWDWAEIVVLAVRLALVPLQYTVSGGFVLATKIALLFASSQNLNEVESVLERIINGN